MTPSLTFPHDEEGNVREPLKINIPSLSLAAVAGEC
jgi:hypothetical protein